MSALPKEQDDGILQTHKSFLDGSVSAPFLFRSARVSREAGARPSGVSTSLSSDSEPRRGEGGGSPPRRL